MTPTEMATDLATAALNTPDLQGLYYYRVDLSFSSCCAVPKQVEKPQKLPKVVHFAGALIPRIVARATVGTVWGNLWALLPGIFGYRFGYRGAVA